MYNWTCTQCGYAIESERCPSCGDKGVFVDADLPEEIRKKE